MVGGSLRVLWFFSTTKTGRHDITEILLKVALSTNNQIKSNPEFVVPIRITLIEVCCYQGSD
jgi:hypothetical protein